MASAIGLFCKTEDEDMPPVLLYYKTSFAEEAVWPQLLPKNSIP